MRVYHHQIFSEKAEETKRKRPRRCPATRFRLGESLGKRCPSSVSDSLTVVAPTDCQRLRNLVRAFRPKSRPKAAFSSKPCLGVSAQANGEPLGDRSSLTSSSIISCADSHVLRVPQQDQLQAHSGQSQAYAEQEELTGQS